MSAPTTSKLWYPAPRALWAILGIFAALVLAYNFIFPPFEPTDEWAHFEYVRYLIEKRALPVAQTDRLTEFHQPPLYYAVAALVSWPFSADDRNDYTQRANPYRAYRYWEPGLDNKNLFLHGDWDLWPFHTTSLSVHVARLASLLLGLGTVWLTYQMAILLLDQATALAVTGLVAFLPMFLAVSGSLQNDTGAAFAGALTLWLGVRCYAFGLTARRALGLGVALGIGILMKFTVAVLLAPAVLMIFTAGPAGSGSFKRRLGYLLLLGAATAASGGWWYWRNQQLYGEPTAVNVILEAYGGRTIADGFAAWGPGLYYAWTTFWGRFGHTDVILPAWVYDLLAVITVLALAGVGLKAFQGLRTRRNNAGDGMASPAAASPGWWPFVFLLVAGVAEFISLWIYLTINPNGYMGRLAFPALPAYMFFLALGLRALAPRRAQPVLAMAMPGAMLFFATTLLPTCLIPVYTPPPAISALPAGATPLDIQFSDIVILKGYRLSTTTAQPGGRVYVTLYWQPLRRTDQPFSTYLHLLNQDGILVAQRDTYPGLGRNATTTWAPGRMFADRYLVVLPETALAPDEAHWETGLWQKETGERAFVVDAAGQPVAADAQVGALVLQPRPGQVPNPADINFAGQARLVGYQIPRRVLAPGESLDLTVYWKAEKLAGDAQLRVRVMTEGSQAWADGTFDIQVPAQTIKVTLAPDTPPGLYDLTINLTQDEEELPMLAADGHALESILRLTGVKVTEP